MTHVNAIQKAIEALERIEKATRPTHHNGGEDGIWCEAKVALTALRALRDTVDPQINAYLKVSNHPIVAQRIGKTAAEAIIRTAKLLAEATGRG